MKALITGASSGLGKDFSIKLSNMGYDLILVSRNKEKMDNVLKDIKTNVKVYLYDLSNMENIYKLYEETKDEDISLLINNAGFGLFGDALSSSLKEELNMIDLNVKGVQALTKLYLKDMVRKDKGIILNVSSSASFLSGPLMSTYYATKAYVRSYSEALYEELRRSKSNVHISVLCPGPVNTCFNDRANVKFSLKGLESSYVVEYALKKTFKHKLIIIPGFFINIGILISRILPRKLLLRITYNIQKKKE
ncbi:MAG: SDR family oxidoreductase [Bacilli bacterium]